MEKTKMKNAYVAVCSSLLAGLLGCSEDLPELHLYTWSDYVSHDVVAEFEAENRCRVVIDSFDSNEAMYAKLKAGAAGYDVVFPSSYQVDMMAKEGMLETLDQSKIGNVVSNFDHSYDHQVLDPSFRYSVPYVVTYTGIMYLKGKVSEEEASSWSVFGKKGFAGKMSLLDDIREVIGAGLMYNGYSINSTSQEEIDKAVETVIGWKRNIRKFDAESYKTEVPNRSSWVGHGYSSDSVQVALNDGDPRDDIGFALPNEGFTIAFDEMAIMKDAPQKELAYRFVDFVYRTESAVKNMEYVCGPMPQKEALARLPATLRKVLALPAEKAAKGQVLRSFVGRPEISEMYNKAWDRIKAMDD